LRVERKIEVGPTVMSDAVEVARRRLVVPEDVWMARGTDDLIDGDEGTVAPPGLHEVDRPADLRHRPRANAPAVHIVEEPRSFPGVQDDLKLRPSVVVATEKDDGGRTCDRTSDP
jgi:hypothetical protein